MDELLRLLPGDTVPLHPVVSRLRTGLATATSDLLRIPDAGLETAWPWEGGEADVRYGFYRAYELLEELAASVAATLPVSEPSAARDAAQAAGRARWDLHGLCVGLDDATLDADPGGGEWTVRQTLGHIVSGQRGYGWGTAWWLNQRFGSSDETPERIPEDVFAELPSDEQEGEGSMGDIRDRLDLTLDAGAARYATLRPADLAVRARWSGIPVTVAFRLWRWSSHLREHTVQLDKTLVLLERHPTEVERLVRLLHDAYGRVESQLLGLPPEVVARPRETVDADAPVDRERDGPASDVTAADLLAPVADRLTELAASVAAAADAAAVPA